MAIPTTNPTFTNNSYAGEFADVYINAAILSAPTASEVTVMSGVGKDTLTLGKLTDAFAIGDFACTWTGADTDIDEVQVTLKKLGIQRNLCKERFSIWWESAKLGMSEHNMTYQNMSFADAFLAYAIERIAGNLETQYWQGSGTGNAGNIDGFEFLLAADGTVVDVVGTTITSSNVIVELDKINAVIPTTVYGKEDLVIYAGTLVIKSYIAAQAALGYLDRFHVGTTELNYQGIPLVHCPGMSASAMVAAQRSNMVIATSQKDDDSTIKVLDMEPIDTTEQVRFNWKFKVNCQILTGADIVFYT